MELDVAPRVLTWTTASAPLRRGIEREYEALLHESLRRVPGSDEWHAAGLGADDVRRVLYAPRTAQRLLWPRTTTPGRTKRFLRNAFAAEEAIALGSQDGFSGWTADCRAFVRRGGEIRYQPVLSGTSIPLDMRSPHARSLDLWGASRICVPARDAPGPEASDAMAAAVDDAWMRILRSPGSVSDCVAAWTRTVVVQVHPSDRFWSGSNGQQIGRVMLVNPTERRTSIADIADAMVHEAIHGFLSMHERVEPWVRDPSLYTDEPALASPWTGNPLPVRPFLQACFVWYGLTMFWGEHLNGETFDSSSSHRLLVRAVRGFCGTSFADMLWPWRDRLQPEVVELVTDLQRTARSLVE